MKDKMAALLLILFALRPTDTRQIDRLIEAYMSKQGIPGMSVAIARDGKVILTHGYGLADVENKVLATAETVFRTASIGKSITATAAMRLVEEGKLDLDQPIQRYCKAFPEKQWPITPRHLLTHTSGIRHYGGPHDVEEQTSTVHYANVADALAPFKNDPLLFEPGTKSGYSTYGYDVLGCVVEGAAGKPFMDVVRELVFVPSGMIHSRDDDPSAIIANRSGGYTMIDGKLRNATHVDMSNRLPAGGYVTTVSDLARFASMFIDCKLVSCATRDAMLTETKLKNGDIVNYGMGWAIGEDQSGKTTGEAFHGGSSPGVSGMLYIVPGRRLAVVILSNLEVARDRFEVVQAIGKIASGR